MAKKVAKPKIPCTVLGCTELSGRKRGFCNIHYSRLKRGIIDHTGRKLREPFSQNPLNVALRSTLRLVRQADSNADVIHGHMQSGDKLLKRPLNRRLLDINRETAGKESRLVEKDFVFGNIHLLQPKTIQAVLAKSPVKARRTLTVSDKARIVWHLLRGVKSEKVVEMFPTYTLKQVRHVAKEVRDGKLPVMVEAMKGRKL